MAWFAVHRILLCHGSKWLESRDLPFTIPLWYEVTGVERFAIYHFQLWRGAKWLESPDLLFYVPLWYGAKWLVWLIYCLSSHFLPWAPEAIAPRGGAREASGTQGTPFSTNASTFAASRLKIVRLPPWYFVRHVLTRFQPSKFVVYSISRSLLDPTILFRASNRNSLGVFLFLILKNVAWRHIRVYLTASQSASQPVSVRNRMYFLAALCYTVLGLV